MMKKLLKVVSPYENMEYDNGGKSEGSISFLFRLSEVAVSLIQGSNPDRRLIKALLYQEKNLKLKNIVQNFTPNNYTIMTTRFY